MNYFLATGNIVSNTGLDLMQPSGYTVVAEKLNFYRYLSHFRSIHRGSFFAELKTTAVRKLLPEAWGFLCPVHTPDGSPCGLLNHLSYKCKVVTQMLDTSSIPQLCASFGMEPIVPGACAGIPRKNNVKVLLDGRILGSCSPQIATKIAEKLRYLKVTQDKRVPLDLELGLLPVSHGGQYPGLYLFSSPARMMRPVTYLATGQEDMVGSFEQVFMDIACLEEDIAPGVTTHQESAPTNMLSVIANFTPFSDFNQSPRNMYQCQMGKQTMGTPAHAFPHRTDNKLYRIMTGQTPIVRPKLYNSFGLDNYPHGTNAIVAVISYTGYDMEDAMILNKSSYDRGFFSGLIYKSEFVDLSDLRERGEPILHHFGCPDPEKIGKGILDYDGLPKIGSKLTTNDPYYSYVNDTTGTCRAVSYKGMEDAIVDDVILCGAEAGNQELQKICIKLRINRNPIIGDKFSSRHGQKGVCSQRYPVIDLPFTESGMTPDVIINPHAFPSRMTIGMFVESMAGKAGALHGICQDATPFNFNEDKTAVDYFGEQLRSAGYNYYGNEPMYSGVDGRELHADIYIGVSVIVHFHLSILSIGLCIVHSLLSLLNCLFIVF
jgi:DNA-directed RNA polymerase I subunit RPA2